jgi:hypothetical protein
MTKFNIFKKARRLSRQEQLVASTNSYIHLAIAPMSAAAIASFVTTFSGVKLITEWLAGSSSQTELLALLVSFVAAGVSLIANMMTINLLRLYDCGRATAIGLVVLLYLFAVTAVSSTYTSFISMTHASARGLYLMELSSDYARYSGQLRQRLVELENAHAVVAAEAEDACEKFRTEQTTGLISGSRGTGPVSSKLQTLCSRKTSMVLELETTIESAAPLIGEIRILARALDSVIFDTSQTLSARELSFIQKARELEGLLEDMRSADRMRSIRASYEAIGAAVEGLEALKATVSIGQANALTEIISSELASSQTISQMIDQIELQALPLAVRAELIPAPRIVLRYVADHLPQLALAVSLDAFGPVSALLFFAAGLRRRRHTFQTSKKEKRS